MRKKTIQLLCLLTLLCPLALLAQVTLSGTVTDASKNPLSGVSVRLLNTNIGTTTEANGQFSLSVPDRTGTLEFTYIGFQSQTLPVSNITGSVTISMQEDAGR